MLANDLSTSVDLTLSEKAAPGSRKKPTRHPLPSLLKHSCTQDFRKAKEQVPSQIQAVRLKLQSGLVAQAAQKNALEAEMETQVPGKAQSCHLDEFARSQDQ